MARTQTDFLWILALATLVALAVPWFLWRDATVLAGLPVWLWWHVGWMGLASVVFYLFTRRAWDRGMGVDPDPDPDPDGDPVRDREGTRTREVTGGQ
jgi:hypothetical protein